MLKYTFITAFGLMLNLHCMTSSWAANIYKWVDANGRMHYADRPNNANARPINLTTPLESAATTVEWRPTASATTTKTPQQVNINSADAATLAQVLHGVGEQKASAIVAHRKKHGPFKSADALDQVKGIGEKIVATNRTRIIVR